MSKGVQIAAAAVAVAGLIGWYGMSSMDEGDHYQYFQTLDEFRAAGSSQTTARVHGYVVTGSIDRSLENQRVRFQVQNDPPHAAGLSSNALPVVYASLETPDLFKDGAEVVVEGQLVGEGGDAVFHATKLFAKCPSKFRPEDATQASL